MNRGDARIMGTRIMGIMGTGNLIRRRTDLVKMKCKMPIQTLITCRDILVFQCRIVTKDALT